MIEEAKSSIVSNEEKILQLNSKQVNLRNELTEVMKEVQGALARKRRLVLENEKVVGEKKEIEAKLQSYEIQLSEIKTEVLELQNKKAEEEKNLDELKKSLGELEQKIDALEKRKLFYISQKDFIEKMNMQYDDMPEAVSEGKFFTDTPPEEHHTGIIGKVKTVNRNSSKGLGGPFAFFNKFTNKKVNGEYEIICETKFIEIDPEQMTQKIEDIEKEISVLASKKDDLNKNVEAQIEVVKSLAHQVKDKETSFSVLEAQLKDVLSENEKLDNELESVDQEMEEVEETLQGFKKKEEELNYNLDTATKDLEYCQNQIKEKQDWIAEKGSLREEVNVSVAQMETEIQSDEEKLRGSSENLMMLNEALDTWLEEIQVIDTETTEAIEKNDQLHKENELLDSKIIEYHRQSEEYKREAGDYEVQKEDVTVKINSVKESLNVFSAEMEEIRNELHEMELDDQKLGFGNKGITDRLKQTYDIEIEGYIAGIERHNAEVDAAEQRAAEKLMNQLEAVGASGEEESQEVAVSHPPAVVEGEVVEESTEGEEPEGEQEQEEEIKEKRYLPEVNQENHEEMLSERETLVKRCKSYGNVNLAAMDEYEELKERFEFLTKQQSDLLEAKSQLMATINKINRTTRQMFMDTFTRVTEEFRIYFKMMFGGGNADLILLDPENVLESGIDIVAKPPGKKLQSISLLSGGEKTLTAIALIFGVFKVNPSPFCVLDEIDAALDESNVGRFGYLLKDFANISQFIVITHNKKTMEGADVMYGVTMPETGCSRIVSVNFSKDKKGYQEAKEPANV